MIEVSPQGKIEFQLVLRKGSDSGVQLSNLTATQFLVDRKSVLP